MLKRFFHRRAHFLSQIVTGPRRADGSTAGADESAIFNSKRFEKAGGFNSLIMVLYLFGVPVFDSVDCPPHLLPGS